MNLPCQERDYNQYEDPKKKPPMFQDVSISVSKIDLLAPKPFAPMKIRKRPCPFTVSAAKSPKKIKKEINTETYDEKKTEVDPERLKFLFRRVKKNFNQVQLTHEVRHKPVQYDVDRFTS